MPTQPRPLAGSPLRRAIALLVPLAGIISACGADAGVVTLSATPTPTVVTIPPVAPPVTPSTGEPVSADETLSMLADELPAAGLPPIVEPELLVAISLADVVDVDDNKPPREHDEFVAVALTDIERWWGEVFPDVYGEPHEPLEGGVYAGYPERGSPIPGCGTSTTDYLDLQMFVAFYCELGDFMAYDDGDSEESLLTPLADAFGPAVMGVVLAHEYGHAIQGRIGALDDFLATIVTEQQADCFAGAWTGQAYRGESPLLRLGDADLRSGLLAMLEVRDPVGTNQFEPGGHGSAFDRVGAFQEGFVAGPTRCAELLENPLPLMPNQFRDAVDQGRGGNAPYDCSNDPDPDCSPVTEFLAEDLNDFWQTAVGDDFVALTAIAVDDPADFSCDDMVVLATRVAICASERTVVYDGPEVFKLYNDFGDFALGYLYGIGWAEFVQQTLASPLTGEDRALLGDCFTGAWVRDITPDDLGNTPRQGDRDGDGVPDTVTSSPGDLDEAIMIAILVGDTGINDDVVGSPFEKIDNFRTGVLGGLPACEAILAG